MILKFKACISIAFSLLLVPVSFASQPKSIEQRVDSVMKLMTLDEKVGQLNQYSSSWSTGPVSPEGDKMQEIKDGKVGSLLNVKGADKTRSMQKIAMQSRLRIPLLFGEDVIHGLQNHVSHPTG